ncbi:MAG: hypothetical protein IKL20_00510 [Alistipes sp.]|nr:hypothetical protein [Alistipes sp.]
MKKFSTILLLVAVSLSVTSCTMLEDLSDWFFGKKSHREEQPAYKPHEVRIYSNAYDGFVNVRDAPTTKSTVLGKLRNGEDYLVQVGAEGNWIAVKWHGMTGFVNKSVVGKNPWKPVYIDVSADEIAGCYFFDGDCTTLLIFNNGKYATVSGSEYGYIDLEYGTWKFEGTEIVLKTKYVTESGRSWGSYRVGKEVRYGVNTKWKSIGVGTRIWNLNEVLVCGSTYKEYYRMFKKEANKYVKLK